MGGGECANGELSVQSMGEVEKDFCPNILQQFLKKIKNAVRDSLIFKSKESWTICKTCVQCMFRNSWMAIYSI